MKRIQSIVLGVAISIMVGSAPAAVTLYSDETAWKSDIIGLESFVTNAANVGKADELAVPPGNGTDCGANLTFSTTKTGLSRGFAVETMQLGATFVFNNTTMPGMVNALSVGSFSTTPVDRYENDDWRLQFTSGPAAYAVAFRVGDNDRNAGETFTVRGLNGEVLGTFGTPTSPNANAFVGVCSSSPIGGVVFDEGIDADHISISDFQFGSIKAPVKQTINSGGGVFRSDALGHYSVGLTGQQLVATIRVKLTGDSPTGPGGEDLKNKWETGIENTWNGQYVAIEGGAHYPVSVDIQWVTEGEDFAVSVHNNNNGEGYPVNSLNFCTDKPRGWTFVDQGLVAAHEAGHWLGLLDEYTPENPTSPGVDGLPARWPLYSQDGSMLTDWWGLYDGPNGQPLGDRDGDGTPDWEGIQALADQTGLMGRNGHMEERYYQHLVEWLAEEAGRDIVLGQAPTYTLREPGSLPADGGLPVPEPATVYLLALGCLAVLRRKRK